MVSFLEVFFSSQERGKPVGFLEFRASFVVPFAAVFSLRRMGNRDGVSSLMNSLKMGLQQGLRSSPRDIS